MPYNHRYLVVHQEEYHEANEVFCTKVLSAMQAADNTHKRQLKIPHAC